MRSTRRSAHAGVGQLSVPAEMYEDPYPGWHRLRKTSPAHRLPTGVWLITRYDDVDRILRDRSARRRGGTFQRPYGPGPARTHADRVLVALDPPDHTRLRSLVGRSFLPRRIAGIEERVRELVRSALEELVRTGELVGSFAYRVPLTVVCDLLGIPEDERAPFRGWSRSTARSFDPDPTPVEVAGFDAATTEAYDYLRELLARRRRVPGEDLLSDLCAVQDGGEQLTDDEIVALALFLVFAGHETTTNLVGNAVHALLEHPGQLDLLCRRPQLLPQAVAEFLRYDSPIQASWATYPHEVVVAGETVPAGESLSLVIGAANRDPDRYPDPDRLDLGRDGPRHLAFGAGIHVCLGSALAELEARLMLGGLLQRFPDLRAGGRPVRKRSFVVRGFASYPLEL